MTNSPINPNSKTDPPLHETSQTAQKGGGSSSCDLAANCVAKAAEVQIG